MFSLGELADQLDLTFSGESSRQLTGLASLQAAGPGDITFFSERKYLAQLAATHAGAVILSPEYVEEAPGDCLISDTPYLTFARVSRLFAKDPAPEAGIHPAATVSAEAQVDDTASVAANAVVEAGARVAAGAVLGAGAYLGHDSRIGEGSRIYPQVAIYHDVHIGRDCVVHSQSVLGADGFGYAPGPRGWDTLNEAFDHRKERLG